MEDKILNSFLAQQKEPLNKQISLIRYPQIFGSLKAYSSLGRPHKEYFFINTSPNSL